MDMSSLVERIGGKGAAAWDVHYEAIEVQKAGADVIFLTVGDSDLDTPPVITRAAIEALSCGDTHYTEAAGRRSFRRAISETHRRRTGQEIGENNVVVLAGAQCGLFCASMCLAEAGNEVIAFDPMFATYEATIRASGATLVRVPHIQQDGFRPDLAAFRRAINSKTRAVFIASPGNPTGCVFSIEELQTIADLAIENDLWVIFDEVYHDLVFDGQHVNIGNLPMMLERTITVSSLSKSFAMTGWRVGWVIAPDRLVGHFENLALAMLYGLPGFIQEAGFAALVHAQDEVIRMRDAFRRRRDILVCAINRIEGLSCRWPQAGMFALVDVRKSGLSSSEFCTRLLAETGVAALDAGAFGEFVQGFVRMSFAIDENQLVEAVRRIEGFMQSRLRAVASF